MRVFDTFCFFNEELIVELRLKTLWDFVDVFVIVESRYTFTGHQKPLRFSLEKYSAYAKKIRYIVHDSLPGGLIDPWSNERSQRNAIARGLFDASPDDLILVSDVDEIPNPEKICSYDPAFLRGDFEQRYFAYFFNNQLVEPKSCSVWRGSKITSYRWFREVYKESAESVRSFKSVGLFRAIKRTYFKMSKVQSISNGGWHFTWVADLEGLLLKMSATSHQEHNREEWRSGEYLQGRILNGLDIAISDRRYRRVPLDESFPKDLLENSQHYRQFLLA